MITSVFMLPTFPPLIYGLIIITPLCFFPSRQRGVGSSPVGLVLFLFALLCMFADPPLGRVQQFV